MDPEKSKKISGEMELLAEGASSLGIHLPLSRIHLFDVYLRELWEWNRRFNLTGVKSPSRMVTELFLDSLVPAPFLPEEGTMLDVGSGAGFPGVPLKMLHPGIETWLLESNSRKGTFLRHIIRLLGLEGTRVIQGRIESARDFFCGEEFHVITARALADLSRIVQWCGPLLREKGVLVAFLGSSGEAIVEKNTPLLTGEGLTIDRHIPYVLPGKTSKRHTFLFKKVE